MIIIETTFPNIESAKNLANILVTKKLCACVHMFHIESVYEWDNKVENSNEILLKIKTTQKLYEEIETIINNNHPYQIPEIISTKIDKMDKKYQNWLKTSLKS